MTQTKTLILAVSSTPNWFTNIAYLHNNKGYEIFSSLYAKDPIKLIKIRKPNILIIDKNLSVTTIKSFYKQIFSLEIIELPIVIVIGNFRTSFEAREFMDFGVDGVIASDSIRKLPCIIESQLTKRERILQNKTFPMMPTLSSDVTIEDDDIKHSAKFNDYLFLDDKTNPGFYAIKDFVYISSLKDYTQIHTTQNKTITIHKTLNYWEMFLPNDKFLRIHRQTIINLDHVEKVVPSNSYRYNIFLNKIVTPFTISQRYSQKIKNGWGVK